MCRCPHPCQPSLCKKFVAYQVINPALHFMTMQPFHAATYALSARLYPFYQQNA